MELFSRAAQSMQSSEIRRLMSLAADPSIISFSGGMPNNSLFPDETIADIWKNLEPSIRREAFQYCPTSGYPRLIEALKKYLESKGIDTKNNALIITTGAQQAINLTAKILVDARDTVLTEYPSFIGAVAAFKSYEACCVAVEMDSEGICVDKLAAACESLSTAAKLLYVSPYFHNPAGILYSDARKKALIDFVRSRNLLLLEDDPYGELYFDESDRERTVPMKAMARDSATICYTGSFAKIFGPGMRLGWLLGPKNIVEKCELAKQSMDACSPTFTQVLAWAFMRQGYLQSYVAHVRNEYRRRAEIMLDALAREMPDGVEWTRPKGGFYIWVTLPAHIDSTDIFEESLKKGAAFVIGKAFDPEGMRNNCFRLAFSHTAEERIAEGIAIIGQAVKNALK